MSARQNFTIVTRKNAGKISRIPQEKKGYLLIAQPGPNSFGQSVIDARIDLFYKPNFPREAFGFTGDYLTIDRDKDRDKHRQYFLKPIPEPTGDPCWDTARDFFEKLKVGTYQFSISPQTIVGMGINHKKGITLYISPKTSLEKAFITALGFIMNQIDHRFEVTDFEAIIKYIMTDLKNKSVLKKNMKAGQEADMAVGL